MGGVLPDGRVIFTTPIPNRGHGIAQHPHNGEIVVVSRRPNTILTILHGRTYRAILQVHTPENRHLYGHGVYSKDGTKFFTTENDFTTGDGVVGIHDTERGYERLGEIRSGGIGPHELLACPDGRSIVVANGGIRTHPDTGRSKLNVKSMEPNLTFLDIASGRVIKSFSLPPELHQLSVRHIDVSAEGVYAIGMQFEGDRQTNVSLVGLLKPGGSITLLKMPAQDLASMKHYVGSVCFDALGSSVAASSPRGNVVVIWNANSGRFLRAFPAKDSSGLVATNRKGEFIAMGGDGMLHRIDAMQLKSTALAPKNTNFRWDNHSYFIGNAPA